MRLLVTGGAGFIGTNLADSLLEDGWEVFVMDNLSRKGSKQNLEWLKNKKRGKLRISTSDIRNFNLMKKAVSKVEIVVHLAGQVAVTTSFVNPREDFESNALGTFNILEAARISGHKPAIIFASSNKVYGQMKNKRIIENKKRYMFKHNPKGICEKFPLDFHSPYGCSKGVADQYMRDYYRMYGIPTIIFRQSCIYGKRQMGVEDQGWITHIAAAVLLGKEIKIYGNGKQVRDILNVVDLIDGYKKVIKNIAKSKGKIYNIGGGVENSISLLEYIDFLREKTEKKIMLKFKDWRLGDQKIYITDYSKFKKEFNWSPIVGIKEGLSGMINWVEENLDYFK